MTFNVAAKFNMLIRVNIILKNMSVAEKATVIAILKELQIDNQCGDEDGRCWVDFSGEVDSDSVQRIIQVISKHK